MRFAERRCADVRPDDIFSPTIMLPRCEGCPCAAACRQEAADSPTPVVGVWGGLVLPAQRDELPEPTRGPTGRPPTPPVYNKKGGPRPWWWDLDHRIDPDLRR